jgi:DNA-binding MarR family transcriptional regulator
MIVRASEPSDRRLVVLKPTAKGRRVVQRALAPVLEAMATIVDGVADDELAVVDRFLEQVESALHGLSDR